MDDGTPSLGVGFAIDGGGSFEELLRIERAMDSTEGRLIQAAAKIEKATGGMLDLGRATASMTSFGNAVTREVASAARELSKIEKAGESLSRQLDRQGATFGKTKEEIRLMKVETAALAAEQQGLTELAGRLRAQEAALAGQELSAARAARFEAEAAAEEKAAAAVAAVNAAAIEARAMQNAAAAHQAFENRVRQGLAAMREMAVAQKAADRDAAAAQLRAEADATAKLAQEQARLAAMVRGSKAAQEADHASLERLRASTDPLYAATKRLNEEIAESTRLYHAGITPQAEYARQQEVLAGRVKQLGGQHDEAAKAVGRNNFALKQTALQLPDIIQGLLTGQKPMTIFIQQGGQIAQIAQMAEGGVKGFAAELGGLALRFAPLLGALAVAAGALALFQRSISSGIDTKAMVDGLGLTHQEIKRLKNTTVTTGDVIKATFEVVAKDVGISLTGMTKWFGEAMDWMTTAGRQYLAALYAEFSGTFRAIGVIVKDVFEGKAVGDIMADVGKAYKGAFKDADDALIKFGKDVTKQVASNKLTDLQKQAAAIKADRTPKTDSHAATLAREAAAMEAQIQNTYALVEAYKLSGGAALIAEARVKAESDAIKKRADVTAAVDRQIRLAIAQRTADGQRAEQAMDEQAKAQEQVNAMVRAGLIPAARANEILQDRLALLPLQAALQAAEISNKRKEADEAYKTLRDYEAAQKRLREARAQSAFDASTADGRDKLAELREELRLVGEIEIVRTRSLTVLKAQQDASRWGWDDKKAKAYVQQQLDIVDAAGKVALKQSAWNEQMERFTDIAVRADNTARSMANAFGEAGSAIGDVISILGRYGEEQARIDDLVRTQQKSQAWGAKQSADLQLNSMIGLTGAAKGLFAENSKGYKAMVAAEQALTVVQLARTAVDVAGGAARMFASLGPFAFPAVAAMLGVMASLGFGGGASTNYSMPKNDGTGTVLGDSAAKSESIKRAIDALKEVDTLTNSYAREMSASLKSIDSRIGGVASVLVRSGMIGATGTVGTENTLAGNLLSRAPSALAMGAIGSAIAGPVGFLAGSALGALTNVVRKIPVIGDIVGGISDAISSLFSARLDVTATGVAAWKDSLGNILKNGLDLDTYNDVTRTKKFFGVVSGRSSWTDYTDQGQGFGNQFTMILQQFSDAILASADPLGVATGDVMKRLDGFIVDIGKIELSGLSGTEIQEKLTSVFGAVSDKMAETAFPSIAKFQKVGEGAFETLVRVASTVESVTNSLTLLGRSVTGLGLDAKVGLADQFESVSAMTDAMQSYFQTYYSKEEQVAARTAQFGRVFDSLGLAMPATLATFRQLVEAQDLTTTAGQATYATLLQLAPAFADLQSSLNGAKSAADILSERQDLQRQLLELNGDTAALRALDLAKLDSSNRALQEQVWAVQDAQKAAQAADELRQAWTSVGDSIMDEVKRIRGLTSTGGNGSFASLMGQFNAATSAARGGDQDAAKSLPALSQALLKAAEDQATSRQELARVQAQTAASLEATYGAIGALLGGRTSASTIQAAASVALASSGTSAPANDDLVSEVKALRDELAQMRADNNAGHAAVASKAGAIVTTLDNLTAPNGGDALTVTGRAA